VSAHTAIAHGKATANVPRACRGTAARGRSEARTPGRTGAVSGSASTATAAKAKAPSSSHQTRWVGAGPYWTSALVPSPPAARPRKPAALVTTGCLADARGGPGYQGAEALEVSLVVHVSSFQIDGLVMPWVRYLV
jgi:hypothetical protein